MKASITGGDNTVKKFHISPALQTLFSQVSFDVDAIGENNGE